MLSPMTSQQCQQVVLHHLRAHTGASHSWQADELPTLRQSHGQREKVQRSDVQHPTSRTSPSLLQRIERGTLSRELA